jgi:hypothetical protein
MAASIQIEGTDGGNSAPSNRSWSAITTLFRDGLQYCGATAISLIGKPRSKLTLIEAGPYFIELERFLDRL